MLTCSIPDGPSLEMRKDAPQRDLPEASARHYCLHQGVEAPDLATIKEFFFAFISLRATAGSWRNPRSIRLTLMLNRFFAGFTRITGTEINRKDRLKPLKVSASPYKRGGSNLIVSSESG